jgi:hypothetical protein
VMKLDRIEVICEQPAKTIRDFLGRARNSAFHDDDDCDATILDKIAEDYFGKKSKAVLAELFKRRWMVKGKRDGENGEPKKVAIVSLTQSGRQSRAASLQKRFPRAVGDEIVAELVGRARAINARDDLLCGVSELRLFGSMLDPKAEMVGDVDIAISLYRKEPPAGKAWTDWNIERAKASGRYLQYIAQLCYGTNEVKLLLKARKPRLSLHEISDLEKLEPVPKSKVIFTSCDTDKETRGNKATQ